MPNLRRNEKTFLPQAGILTALGLLLLMACPALAQRSTPRRPADPDYFIVLSKSKTYLGIDVLEQRRFQPLAGKSIGLLTHPAGVNREGVSTISVLRRSPRFKLVALFGPEHGLYGDEKADQPVDHRIDRRTGLPVYSLYGKYRKPTPRMLSGLDALVIDLQDLGVRSYTYLSAMRLAMEACFQNDIEVIVLDRPNPLGGLKVDGPPLEEKWRSYVGAFPMPYVHGLTIGELAAMAKKIDGWLDIDPGTRRQGRLTVIPMQGWRRSMMWPDTGLKWTPTSPAIPDLSAALGYSMTGLGAQIGKFQHGYGTRYPFRLLTYRGKSPEAVLAALRAKNIPGLDYRIIQAPKPNGTRERGVYIWVTDWNLFRPTEISFYMMQIACAWNGNPFAAAGKNESNLFNKHVGSTPWWNTITTQGEQVNVAAFIRRWQRQADGFQTMSKKYWLYR